MQGCGRDDAAESQSGLSPFRVGLVVVVGPTVGSGPTGPRVIPAADLRQSVGLPLGPARSAEAESEGRESSVAASEQHSGDSRALGRRGRDAGRGRRVVRAMTESGIRVLYVIHLVGPAQSLSRRQSGRMLSLRAERREDGQRTFKLHEGLPLETSFGKDLYRQVFDTLREDRSPARSTL